MSSSDAAVLDAIEQQVLTPEVVTTSVQKALARLRTQLAQGDAEVARLATQRRLAAVERELENLTAAIAAGGKLSMLVGALTTREAEPEPS